MGKRHRPRATVELRLVPGGPDRFQVRATHRGERYPYSDNPIGVVERDGDLWRHTVPWARGCVYGGAKTKEGAAAECYRAHRSWVGY